MQPNPSGDDRALSDEAARKLKSESAAQEALESLDQQKAATAEKKAQDTELKKKAAKKRAAKKRAAKKAQKAKREKRNADRKAIADTTPHDIAMLKRPRINSDGSESTEQREHTYESAELELKKQGVQIITAKTCHLSPLFKISHYPAALHDRSLHPLAWLFPTWVSDGKEVWMYIPPPAQFYLDDAFSLNSDSAWENYLNDYQAHIAHGGSWDPMSKLAILTGLDLSNEAYDESSPYFNSSDLMEFNARDELKGTLMRLGLLNFDKDYSEMGTKYLYPPEGFEMSGINLMELSAENNQTHITAPHRLIENDPRMIWHGMSLDEIGKLRDSAKANPPSTDSEDISAAIDSALMQLEDLVSIREHIQELALIAFKAGQEYTANHRIVNGFSDSQKAESMAKGGNKKKVPTKPHTEIFTDVVKAFEIQSGEQKTTLQKVIDFISASNNSEWKNAWKSKRENSLKGVVHRNRTKK
jgi:hypothetical protein